jgi:hypothetical protein
MRWEGRERGCFCIARWKKRGRIEEIGNRGKI